MKQVIDFIQNERSLSFKLILLFFIGFSLVFSFIFLYSFDVSKNLLKENQRKNAENIAMLSASKVNNVLNGMQKITDDFAEIIALSSYSQTDLSNILKQFVEENIEIDGAAVAFEPYFFDPSEKYYTTYFYRDQELKSFMLDNALTDYSSKNWYLLPKESGKASWIELAFNKSGSLVVHPAYSIPLFASKNNQRNFIGILSVCFSRELWKESLSVDKFSEASCAFVVSQKGAIVAYSDLNPITEEFIFDGEASDREEFFKTLSISEKGIFEFEENNFFSKESIWLVVAPLNAADWSLGIVFPEQEMAAGIGVLSKNLLITALAGIIVLALLVMVLLFMAKSRVKAIGTAAMAKEDSKDALLGISQFSTALKETQDALEAAQIQLIESERMASIGQLTAGIAHEIKNPLNFVNNFALLTVSLANELNEELENLSEKLPEKDKEYLLEITGDIQSNAKKINEHGKRAESIVKGMLLQSRGKSGEFQATDLNALLAEYVNLGYHGMRAQDSNFNIKLDADYDQSIGQVMVIPQNLSRVFLNIINNACYATNEKKILLKEAYNPVLSVQTKNFDDHVEIRIHDNGKGIPQAVIDKVFNPFFTTKPPGQGTGLGLSLSHDIIIKEHKGTMKVESVEGEFAEFIITIPKNLH